VIEKNDRKQKMTWALQPIKFMDANAIEFETEFK
jgi:hypothetical protein